MPKAQLGDRIRLNQKGADFVNSNSNWRLGNSLAEAGDVMVVCRVGYTYAKVSYNGTEWNMDDSEYSLVTDAEQEPVAEPRELVGGLAQLTEAGMSKMRLLGRPADIEARVTARLAGTNWYRIEAPEWGEGGFLFTPDEFSVVDEEEEVKTVFVAEPEVEEAFEVLAIEVRLYDVLYDGDAKAYTVGAIDRYGDDRVTFYGQTNKGRATSETRLLNEYVTIYGRRK